MVLCDESLFHLILLKGCGTHVNAHVELGLQVLANLLPHINYPGGVSRSLSHESLATLGIVLVATLSVSCHHHSLSI